MARALYQNVLFHRLRINPRGGRSAIYQGVSVPTIVPVSTQNRASRANGSQHA
jgi:hypothetical protein